MPLTDQQVAGIQEQIRTSPAFAPLRAVLWRLMALKEEPPKS